MDVPTDFEFWRDDPRVVALNTWITRNGAREQPQLAFLEAYCAEVLALGVPLMRAHVTINALHPVYGSVGIQWQRDEGSDRREYGHSTDVREDWVRSPFYHMISAGRLDYRERLGTSEEPSRFALLAEMQARGATDYYAAGLVFGDWNEGDHVEPTARTEGTLMSWICDGPGGFSDRDLALIRLTFPAMALAMRATSNRKTAGDLLGIYLGADAGQRVLSGEIERGSSRWINAVICYFDLEGFTGMSQQVAGEDLIAMLNDYFGHVVARIEENHGNVLKFMGDGLLAIFDRDVLDDAPDRAVATVRMLRDDIDRLNTSRTANNAETMEYTIALHAGPVLYGNIGANERLDFTVIGPEVNLGARIGGMHRSLGQSVIISQAVAQDVTQNGFELISLGRYMLRGVETPQELFTIHPQTT